MFVLGVTHAFQEQLDDAEPLLEESVQLSRRVLGDGHFWTVYYMFSLAKLYRYQGRYEDAEQLFVKVIEGRRRLFGEKHRDTQLSVTELGKMYTDQGRHDAAEQLFVKALERRRRLLGDKDLMTQACIIDLCLLYEMSGQQDKLKTLFLSNSKMFEKQRTELDEGDAALAGYLSGHARRQATCPVAELRNGPEAIENASKACELSNWKTGRYVGTLAAAYAEAGDFASAIEWQKKAIALLTEEERPLQQPHFEARLKLYESGQAARQSFVRGMAWSHYSGGHYPEAEQMLIKALEFSRRVLGEEHSETLACQEDFVKLYEAWGKPEKAEEWRAKLPVEKHTEK
jgi:tetratricopeptide (TPR) repeat protein